MPPMPMVPLPHHPPTLVHTNRIPPTTRRTLITGTLIRALIACLRRRLLATVALALPLQPRKSVAFRRAEIGAFLDGHGVEKVGGGAVEGACVFAVGEAAEGGPAVGGWAGGCVAGGTVGGWVLRWWLGG